MEELRRTPARARGGEAASLQYYKGYIRKAGEESAGRSQRKHGCTQADDDAQIKTDTDANTQRE